MFVIVAAAVMFAGPLFDPASERLTGVCSYTPAKGLTVENAALNWNTNTAVLIVNGARVPHVEDIALKGRLASLQKETAPIDLPSGKYAKSGWPRVMSATDLGPQPAATRRGVPFFSERGGVRPEVLYAQVNPLGCEWQPYVRQ